MLSIEDRTKPISFDPHAIIRFYERGVKDKLFPHCLLAGEVWSEIVDAIKNPSKSVIIEDKRPDSSSTHICIFVNEGAIPVAVPIALNDKHLYLFTLKDVKSEWTNPNWYIDQYNSIARQRDLTIIPKVVKTYSDFT